MSSDSCSIPTPSGISLVFLNDPSRLHVNRTTSANLLRQQEGSGNLLLQCFYCSDTLVHKKENVAVDESSMSIRMKISSRLLGKKSDSKFWSTCPCCSSVTCQICLSLPVLEGSSGTMLHICKHCFENSSRVRHPAPGLRIGSYHTSDPKVLRYMWEGFKYTQQKVYDTPEEEANRAEVFANNLLRIDVLNENSSVNSSSQNSLAGINRYTDLTGSEYHSAVLSRSRLASDLILLECHESRTDIQDLKRQLSELILVNDFQQFTDSTMDEVISHLQALVSKPQLSRSLSSTSSGDGDEESAVNVQQLEIFCQQSLTTMRKIIPKNVFYITEDTLRREFHYSAELASRLLQTKCLWLIALETADLHQICIADLMGRYAIPADLDIVESAALLSVLPKTFLKGDIDGDKRSWRKVLTVRVAQLYKHQQQGTLKRELMRHTSYPDQPSIFSGEKENPPHTLSQDEETNQSESACIYVQYSSSISSSSSSSTKSQPSKLSCGGDYEAMPDPIPQTWIPEQQGNVIGDYEVMPTSCISSSPSSPTHVFLPHSPTPKWPQTIKVVHESELSVGELIGKGSFGIVRYGTWRGMAVALKSFRLPFPAKKSAVGGVGNEISLTGESQELEDKRSWQDFHQEVKSMMLVCHHSNVVQLVGVVNMESSLSPCIVTVFYQHGSLYDTLIKPHKMLSKRSEKSALQTRQTTGKEETVPTIDADNEVDDVGGVGGEGEVLHASRLVQWALEAARGVSHLHQEGLIHRDLATRNLLLDDMLHVRVCDFGFSRVKEREASRGLTRSYLGPVKWTSPEAMRNKSYSVPSDVFSFGVVLYEIFVQREPWAGQDAIEVVLTVCAGERMTIPPTVPPAIATLMQGCWDHDPSARPSFEEILRVLAALQTSS